MYKDKSSVNESCSSTSSDNSTKTVLITSPIPGTSASSSSFQQQTTKNTNTIASVTTLTTSITTSTTAELTATTANKLLNKNTSSSIIDSNNSINLLSSSSENISFNLNQNCRRSSHPVFSFQSEDINLITDIGYIASQLRYLEKKYSYFNNILGPYEYHKELEKAAINFQNNYNNKQQNQLSNYYTTITNNENDKIIESITKSEISDQNLSNIPISTTTALQQHCLDENTENKIEKNSLEIESLGPISNLIKQAELTQQQQQQLDNTQQQSTNLIPGTTTTTTILTEAKILDNKTGTQTNKIINQTNSDEYSKRQRIELLEDLLIKFYKCQEERIKIQEHIDYQKEIDRRFPKKIYIMSCGSIEKLLSLDDQKNLNNINYNNNRKQSTTSQNNSIVSNNSIATTTTGDNTPSSASLSIASTTVAAVTSTKYYAGSKLFGIPAAPPPISSTSLQTSTSYTTSASNNSTSAIINNSNNKLISSSASQSSSSSSQNQTNKQCSRSSGSLNCSSNNAQQESLNTTNNIQQQTTGNGSTTSSSTTTVSNRTIGIIKQQSAISNSLTNTNRRSSSSIVENRTNSNINDFKTELLSNSRKYSVGTLSSDICGSNSSSINTENTSSQSSFKSATSNAFLKNDNNFLTTSTTKGSSTILLSRSSGNVHFKDEDKSSIDNLLNINDKKSTTIFKSTSDIISHCSGSGSGGGVDGVGGSSSHDSCGDCDNGSCTNISGINIGGSISNINSNSSVCLIERRNSNNERTTTTTTTTTIVCSSGGNGNGDDNNSDYKNQNNNNYSNSNNNNNNNNNNNSNHHHQNNSGNNSNLNNLNNNCNKNNDVRKDSSGSSGSKGSEFNLIQLQNTIIQCQFNNDDLRTVVGDLKRKIDYTEKMNWLCLSKRPAGPPHRKTSLPKHSEVKKRFLEICDKTLSDDIKSALRLPAFDSYDWEDADVIYLMQTMFIELGLIDKFNIPIDTLREWLYEVYKHYNEVPFHNFRHCFCVAQMMYAISHQANLCQRLGELEVLILLVSSICHDLDHPGYNNIYQINARTELALRYNDISPLENHHCSIAFRLLEHPDCNIFKNFSRETFNFIREGIIRCILATDMARHNEILTQFKDIITTFDYSNRSHINLLCMVLIKVADISNEARPMDVAEPWLDRLFKEFFAQSAAEKSEGLPVTPFMDPDKISKPGSQVRFIGLVLLPLFEALGELLPEIIELIIIPVRIALDYYKCLNDAQNKQRKSVAESNTENGSESNGSCSPQIPRSQSGISVKSRRSIPSQKSTSRTSVDEPTCIAAELHDLPEGSESGDSETATEVDVAEKTSKFKVDTESGNRSKASHSTCHRKSNREKRPSMISEMCSSGGRMRNSYGNIHGYHTNRGHFGSNRAVSLDQYSCNNRRSSDGLQQVISDSYVFYNRQNEGLQSQQNSSGSTSTPASDKPKNEQHCVVLGEDVVNMNSSQMYCDQLMLRQMNLACHSTNASIGSITQHHQQQHLLLLQQQQQLQEHNQKLEHGSCGGGGGSGGGGGIAGIGKTGSLIGVNKSSNIDNTNQQCSSSYNQKSWRARFKQITDIFSIFDKGNKRYSSKSNSDPARNNNTTNGAKDVTKQGLCCTISNNYFPSNAKQKQLKHQQSQYIIQQSEITNIGRNRAYSLDVPCSTYRQQRYSSSSGGESRKSSRNEDNSNRQDVFTEDNNSYNTSSGDAPPIRISGGDGSDNTIPISTQPLPKVITPTFEEDLIDSAIYTSSEQQQNQQQQQQNIIGSSNGDYNSTGCGHDSSGNYSSNQPKI